MGLSASAGKTNGSDTGRTLEGSALVKVQSACSYVNAEVDRLRNQTIGIAVACALGALVLGTFGTFGDVRVVLVLATGATVFSYVRAQSEVASSFRLVAGRRIVAGIGQGLTYHPTSSLTQRHFAAMELFYTPCTRVDSSDEICGKVPGAKYSLHRVRASRGERGGVVFDGVVIKLDFDEAFPAHTIIVSDQSSQAGAPPGRKKDLVMMKNPVFEQSFDVYSTDYYEARKAVTPFFMQILLEAQARMKTEMRVCFLNRFLYVTVPGNALQLIPTLFGDRLTPQAALGTAQLVAFAQRLAETQVGTAM
jgi:Protein of unknown function (DUF3137)